MIVLSIPVYGICLWSLYEPEKSYFFFDWWRYKELPELSDAQIKSIKVGSISVMILMTLKLISLAIETFAGY